MRIAVIGGGIAGMTSAWLLSRDHQVILYEAGDYLGGHTHTVDVELEGRHYAIDTGFIVFNDWTYPYFVKLLTQLGVESQASDMSFSVACARTGLEYAGTSLDTFYAQRQNLLRLRFHRLLLDIVRFNYGAKRLLRQPHQADLRVKELCRELEHFK